MNETPDIKNKQNADNEVLSTDTCFATFELANGESVSPCHKPKNHDGNCEGFVLGSRCVWEKGVYSEYEQYLKDCSNTKNN